MSLIKKKQKQSIPFQLIAVTSKIIDRANVVTKPQSLCQKFLNQKTLKKQLGQVD